jgi:hypothetical protein
LLLPGAKAAASHPHVADAEEAAPHRSA